MSVELSRRQRYRLTIASTVGLVMLLGLVWVKPLFDDFQAKQAELSQAQSELPPEHAFNPSVASLKSQLVGLRAQLAAKRSTFPVAESVSTMLTELEGLASNQVVISQFYPTKLAPVKLPKKQARSGISVSEQQIEIVAEGPFDRLYQLLSRFQAYAHPIGVHSIVMEHLVRQKPAAIQAGGGLTVGNHPSDPLRLTLKMSAYLLNKPLPDAPVFDSGLGAELARAQDDAGVQNPFLRVTPEAPTPPSPPQSAKAPAVPSLPAPPTGIVARVATVERSELSGWTLEGVLFGPGSTAIVRKTGHPSISVRVGDTLDGWRISRIAPQSLFLTKGNHHEQLSLPEGLL